jgi:uncharacterized membrane protein
MSFQRKTQIVWLPQDWGKMLPYLALMVTIMATGLSAMFVRWANAPGTVTVFFRTALASIILLPFLLHRNWPLKLTTPISNLRWLPFALLGGLFIALDQGAWSTAVMMTKVANATYFNSIAPLWVAIYALLVLRERLGNLFWCGLGLTLSGSFFILGRDLLYSPHLGQGDIWGVISSIFYCDPVWTQVYGYPDLYLDSYDHLRHCLILHQPPVTATAQWLSSGYLSCFSWGSACLTGYWLSCYGFCAWPPAGFRCVSHPVRQTSLYSSSSHTTFW